MYFQTLEAKGYLDNTVLVLFGDHGPRFSALRHSIQGKILKHG